MTGCVKIPRHIIKIGWLNADGKLVNIQDVVNHLTRIYWEKVQRYIVTRADLLLTIIRSSCRRKNKLGCI